MFRFWNSESRGCDNTNDATTQNYSPPPTTEDRDYFAAVQGTYDASGASVALARAPRILKRRRPEASDTMMPPSPTTELDPSADHDAPYLPTKRIKSETAEPAWSQAATDATSHDASSVASPLSPPLSVSFTMADTSILEQVKDTIQHQFGLEILVKHNELRLIEQEIAKCQIALEQLRRCHLIPYPVACPTPAQMLDIASGRGTAVRPRPGVAASKWAAPFGVVDGPYARHYAKWLIPDPVFDGPLPNWPGLGQPTRSRSAVTAEARAARSNMSDAIKGRPTRGLVGQKLHSLSNGYPMAKDKAGPCVLKRSDGKVVKLVCIDCHRDNFSSTQGFINHCRIAHKRDFKSHEEAAVHCGHPMETTPAPVASPAPPVGPALPKGALVSSVAEPAAAPAPPPPATITAVATPAPVVPGYVCPLASADNEATATLVQSIRSSYNAYSGPVSSGKPIKARARKVASTGQCSKFVGSDQTPYLSRLLEKKHYDVNLDACVQDAKEIVDLGEGYWVAEDAASQSLDSTPSATPVPTAVTRVPTRPTKSSVGFSGNLDGAFSVAPSTRPFVKTDCPGDNPRLYVDDEMDVDSSPNTSASNNAPSLVSDDGEFDDSDDGSASETSNADLGSVSDVAEINMDEDEDHAHDTPRALRHHRSSVKLKKEDPKHVAFVNS